MQSLLAMSRMWWDRSDKDLSKHCSQALEAKTDQLVLIINILDRLTWMKAVAIITPEPKYFAIKKVSLGTCMRFVLARTTGNSAPCICQYVLNMYVWRSIPKNDPNPITNMDDILSPNRPSYPFGPPHWTSTVYPSVEFDARSDGSEAFILKGRSDFQATC